MIIEFSVWGPDFDHKAIYDRLVASLDVTEVILYHQQEWEYITFPYFDQVAELCFFRRIPFKIIICTSAFVKPVHDVRNLKYSRVTIINWGTFWISDYMFNASAPWQTGYLRGQPDKYLYPFVSMNAKPHMHRCLMIDLLASRNLIDVGAVSWLEITNVDDTSQFGGILPSVFRGYQYKYWTPEIMRLSEPQQSGEFSNYYSQPEEYFHSFMQLIAESQASTQQMMSEKTFMPLFHRKPFLVLAATGHYALFTDYGFKLYDEIFDYSFDSEPDIEKRANMIIDNVEKIRNYSQDEFKSLYQTLMPKLEYNYNLAVHLATDINQVPKIILDACLDPTKVSCSPSLVNFIKQYNSHVK